MSIFNKLRYLGQLTLSLPSTIYFNFKYLPLKQAWRLPVFLCFPRISGKGKYRIEGKVTTGMIKIGFPYISIYRGAGAILENKGMIVFKGKTALGAHSGISIGKKGVLEIGHDFMSTYGIKILCYNKIDIGYNVRTGWQILICDTDFHSLKSEDGERYTKGYGSIKIGDQVWLSSFCKLYKNTEIPSKCTVAANTLVNKKIECEPCSLIYSGGGIKIKKTGYYRDIHDDVIIYDD